MLNKYLVGLTIASVACLTSISAGASVIFFNTTYTVEATGPSGASFSFANTAYSTDGLAITYNPNSAVLALGVDVTSVTGTTDNSSATANITVRVQDTTAPTISIPQSPQTIFFGQAPVLPTISDLVTTFNALSISYSENVSALALGDHLITVTARDRQFNTSQSQFEVDVVSATSVPEPTSVALLGLGLIGFSVSRRKSKK